MDIRNEYDFFASRIGGIRHGAAVAFQALVPFSNGDDTRSLAMILRGLAEGADGGRVLAAVPTTLRSAARTAQLALIQGYSQDVDDAGWSMGIEFSIEDIRLRGAGPLACAFRILHELAGCSWFWDEGDEIPQPVEFP